MKSPILFLIFKRADTTKRVFERIREAKPPKLYIAADGPRANVLGEVEKCQNTRKIVENIDWPCEVYHLYRNENLGCGKGVSSAISWFFEHEEQGIIIEDDILAHIDFFRYCDEMLERYKHDERIHLIAGRNWFFDGISSNDSYYLSSYAHIWGWASWKRVWDTYQYDINNYSLDHIKEEMFKRLPKKSAKYFCGLLQLMSEFKIDTWDYQFLFNQFNYGRYSISPYVNMIENIGIGDKDASHTLLSNPISSNFKACSPYPLKHPFELKPNDEMDRIAMINSDQYVKPFYIRFATKIKNVFRKLL